MDLFLLPNLHMWFVLGLGAVSIYLFVRETVSLEITSILVLTALLLFGQLLPLPDANGRNLLDSGPLLAGLANPSLIAVLALLVMGQGIIRTDALRIVTDAFATTKRSLAWISIFSIFVFVTTVSAFLNNTPLVIIAIPLLQILTSAAGVSQSKVMIPLSYAAILGGMTTLIGSSTNLLVSSAMTELGYKPLEFFDFVIPGSIMAGIGFIYVLFIAPRFLTDRSTMLSQIAGSSKKEFVAELDVAEDSKLIGIECTQGMFPALGDLNVKLIQRGGHLILPPFEGYVIQPNDVMIVAATRETLTKMLSKYPGFFLSEEERQVFSGKEKEEAEPSTNNSNSPAKSSSSASVVEGAETRILAEIMISPGSRMLDMTLDSVSFETQYEAVVLGIQRRARAVRRRLGRVRLEAGDVLLIAGRQSVINSMRETPDFIVLSGSKKDMPLPGRAPIAVGIFLTTIASAALGFISIPVAAITGAVAMVASGCLNVRQAVRALDRKIFLLVGSMLALGTALQVTGGARFIADQILGLPFVDTPLAMAAVLFLLVALTTNVLTNNACAILFTPIAMNLAGNITAPAGMDVDIAFVFAVTVIFAANCSFASPIGYQTNLLVMGPGHYRFADFLKAGIPLILILWVTYIFIAKYYFGL